MPASFNAFARSYLFVPALRTDRFAKALASGAHAVIADLEDAVPVKDKESAREALSQWLKENPGCPMMMRANAAGTPWHEDDLRLAALPNVVAVVVPKAERAEEMPTLRDTALIPIIETGRGFEQLEAIAAHSGVRRLVFGTYDFRADLNLGDAPEALLYFSSRLVLASRLANLPSPVDGVMVNVLDDSGWLAEARRARSIGFGGKLCIHPRQVQAVNEGFSPSAAEVAWADKVVAGVGERETAVVDGQFVDRPVLLRARAILQQHGRARS